MAKMIQNRKCSVLVMVALAISATTQGAYGLKLSLYGRRRPSSYAQLLPLPSIAEHEDEAGANFSPGEGLETRDQDHHFSHVPRDEHEYHFERAIIDSLNESLGTTTEAQVASLVVKLHRNGLPVNKSVVTNAYYAASGKLDMAYKLLMNEEYIDRADGSHYDPKVSRHQPSVFEHIKQLGKGLRSIKKVKVLRSIKYSQQWRSLRARTSPKEQGSEPIARIDTCVGHENGMTQSDLDA